jgi:hypothetical protein
MGQAKRNDLSTALSHNDWIDVSLVVLIGLVLAMPARIAAAIEKNITVILQRSGTNGLQRI